MFFFLFFLIITLDFQWVDTVISLKGFCQKSALCTSANHDQHEQQWNELEQLYLVIGSRKLKNGKTYGFALYHHNETTESFQPVTLENISHSLMGVLAKIGLPMKSDEQESVLMLGEFWPKPSGMYSLLLQKFQK